MGVTSQAKLSQTSSTCACESRRTLLGSAFLVATAFVFTAPRSVGATPATHVLEAHLEAVRRILQLPESEIDLAKAKLTIDHLIDPSLDVGATIAQLDALASSLRSMLPNAAPKRLILDALRYHMHTASPWNEQRPFQYDLDDPFGANVRNKLLPTYLATRKGNCVSMPLLFVILGQRLGLDVTVATAPNHVFVKYRDEEGKLLSLETTSGAGFARDAWIRQQFPLSDEAIASGAYMRPLTRKETVVVMVGTLLEFYAERNMQEQRLAMAKLSLEYDPTNIAALLHQYSAHLWKMNWLVNQFPTPNDMPASQRTQVMHLRQTLKQLHEHALALGWRPPTQAAAEAYREAIRRARVAQP